jgi:hypothetical protein
MAAQSPLLLQPTQCRLEHLVLSGWSPFPIFEEEKTQAEQKLCQQEWKYGPQWGTRIFETFLFPYFT